jgi:hypothetical protein
MRITIQRCDLLISTAAIAIGCSSGGSTPIGPVAGPGPGSGESPGPATSEPSAPSGAVGSESAAEPPGAATQGTATAQCVDACNRLDPSTCQAESAAGDCASQCAELVASMPAKCSAQLSAYLGCLASSGTIECDKNGKAQIQGCEAQDRALDDCDSTTAGSGTSGASGSATGSGGGTGASGGGQALPPGTSSPPGTPKPSTTTNPPVGAVALDGGAAAAPDAGTKH